MKHLRIFESKSAEKMVLDTMNEYDKICDLIRDFINLEELYNCGIQVKYVIRYYFENVENNKIAIFTENIYMDNSQNDDCPCSVIEGEILENLYRFIENPEQYKSSKKYNI